MPGFKMFSAIRFQKIGLVLSMWIQKLPLSFQPLGEGSLYAAQIVCVGFHSFPGEGAASWEAARKISREDTVKHEGTLRKNKKNLCNLCNLWFPLFN
jgi:hypothetical protein